MTVRAALNEYGELKSLIREISLVESKLFTDKIK